LFSAKNNKNFDISKFFPDIIKVILMFGGVAGRAYGKVVGG